MKSLIVAAVFAGGMAAQPAAAMPVTMTVAGTVAGFTYGEAAAADIFAAAPVGSSYSFTFSYDTGLAPTFSGPGYANYSGVPIDGALAIGGVSFSIPTAYLNSGTGPYQGVRFSVHTDNVPFSPTRLAGYQLLDYSMQLFDPTGTAVHGELPEALDVNAFANRPFDVRFAFGANGETRLSLTVDRITNVAAVPEPATWLSMVAGFALMGFAYRRFRPTAMA